LTRLRPGRTFAAALGGLTLLALGLRLWELAALGGFDWDEVATVYIARRALPDMLAYLRQAPFEHPPAYYLLAHLWLAGGTEESWLRGLSALLGAATVPVLGLLGAELFGRRVGLAAALLLALAPAHVFYSRDARMYPLLALLCTVALYALVRGLRTPPGRARTGWWAGWAVAALLALATHYYAAFVVAGQVAYLLWHQRRAGGSFRVPLGLALLAGGLLAAWWALAPGLRHSLTGLQLASLPADEAGRSLWRAAAGLVRGPLADEPPLADEVWGGVGLALLGLTAVASWRRYPQAGPVLLAAGLAPALGVAALLLVGRELHVRFLLMLLPVALLALASGWAALWPGGRGTVALLALWAVLTVPWLGPYYASYVRGDYARALRMIEAAEQPGEAVLFNGPWQTLLFEHYYRGRLPAHILTGAVPLEERQVAAALADLAGRYRGFWLLETDMGHADPTGFVPRWLARHAYRHFVVPYRQVRLGHYLLEGPPLAPQPAAYEAGGLALEAVWLEPGALQPDQPRRLELVWRVGEASVSGLKVSVRVRTADGGRWWIADPWLDEGWLAAQPPRAGDRLHTRLAVALPPVATAPPTALEFVVYRSTARPASGEGWIAWTAEPFSLPLGPPSDLAGGAREAVAALPLAP